MATDNAASRLLDLLSKAKAFDQNVPSVRAWQAILETKDPALLLSRLGKMIALPEQISAALSNSVDMAPGVIGHISSQFYAAFSSHKFGEKWEVFVAKIDNHMMNYLAMASTLLETRVKTKQLEVSELEELRQGFVDVLENVRACELSPRLKAYVVLQLHDLIATLDDYFVTGAEPILERIEATIGHAYVDGEYKGFLRDHELGNSLLECLGAAANLVAVAVGVPQLVHVVQLLGHGS
jgi:hypothetical protein